jgi:hypothetical protein
MKPFINFIKMTKITTITIITIITAITIKAITTGLTAILKPVYTGLVYHVKWPIRISKHVGSGSDF